MQMHVLFIHVMSYSMNYCFKIFLLVRTINTVLITDFLNILQSSSTFQILNLWLSYEILHLITSYESVGKLSLFVFDIMFQTCPFVCNLLKSKDRQF